MTPPPVAALLGALHEFVLPSLQAAAPTERFAVAPAPSADVLVTLAPSPDELEGALTDDVKLIHVLGTGVDGFPLGLLGDRTLTCSRGASAIAIAEFSMAAMLAFEKRLPATWITEPPPRWGLAGLGGLAGRTLGIVGLGSIGTELARRALAFDMEVVALRRRVALPGLADVELLASLHELLGRSDHVVIAAPATAATRGMFDAAAFSAIKPGAHLVNVARGSLVDQEALLAALDDGRLAMATLDVVDPEPLPVGHALYAHDKVRVSAHVSWDAPSTWHRTIECFAEDLARWRAGEPLRGVVDVAEGY